MTGWLLAVLLAAPASAPTSGPAAAISRELPPDARAEGDALARRVTEAMGGAAFARLRLVRFDFQVEKAGVVVMTRHHDWDPGRGLAHVALPDGTEVWLDTATRAGVAKAKGAALAGPELEAALKAGFEAWTNDTYWLVAPFKLFDGGVIREAVDGQLRVRFEQVGLTPGDRYLYAIGADGRPTGWSFLLQSGREGTFTFEAPYTAEGVTLFARKTTADGQMRISHPGLSVSATPDPALFAPLGR